MIELTLAEVAAAVSGQLVGADPAARVTGPVEYDSRLVAPGGLFVAFPGERADGHDFAAAAYAAGAVAVIGTRVVAPVPDPVPMVLVDDARTAVAELARTAVSRLPELTVVGLTGSSGKTSTKDMVAQLLAGLGPTVAPAGSLNNELGYPYTVLKAGPETRHLVLEMGARGIGHIRYLCGIARPRIGIVLNVGVAHLGEFGTVEAIAQAKGELVEALPPDGLAVLNADDPRVRAMSARTAARPVLVGEAPDATVRAVEVTLDERGRPRYRLVTPEGEAAVRLPLTGRHQVGNSLAAAAVARELGATPDWIADGLGRLRLASGRRMDVFDRPDGVTVIDDSYNANPASTAAALRALAALGRQLPPPPGAGGRRTVAVLGYMAELGEYERGGHEEVGRLAAEAGVDLLVAVGAPAAPILDGAAAVTGWGGKPVRVTDQEEAVTLLRTELRAGDVVLVKGSRYRTWVVVDALRPAETTSGRVDAFRSPEASA